MNSSANEKIIFTQKEIFMIADFLNDSRYKIKIIQQRK